MHTIPLDLRARELLKNRSPKEILCSKKIVLNFASKASWSQDKFHTDMSGKKVQTPVAVVQVSFLLY